MKATILLSLIFNCILMQAQTFSWVDQFGGTMADRITSMVTDASGNVYVTGRFEGTIDADPGSGIYNLTAAGGSDTFIAKITAAGVLIWVRQIGGSSTYTGEGGNGIAIGPSGNVYVTGTFIGAVDFDFGAGEFIMVSTPPAYESCVLWSDIFVLKLTADGDFTWAKQVGGNGNDEVASIILSTGEEVYVTGEYVSEGNVPVDMDPGVGTFYLTSISGSAAFLLKLDTDGGFMWVKQWFSSMISAGGCGLRDAGFHPFSLYMDGNGNIFCTGDFAASVDFDPDQGVNSINALSNAAFVMKLNSMGTFQWVRTLNNSGSHAWGKDVVVGSNGNVISVGHFDGTIDFDPGSGTKNLKSPGGSGSNGIGPSDAYAWILNASGNYVWAGQLGGNTSDGAKSVDLDGAGNIYVTGEFTGTADFNPSSVKNTLKSAGNTDGFVCKLTGSGIYTWAVRVGGTLYDYSTQVDIDASNNILTSGYFEGQADFDPASSSYWRTSFGATDAFVLKLTQGGPAMNGDPDIVARSISTEIQVFPNPTTEILNVDFAQDAEDVHVRIYDLQGHLILEKSHIAGRTISIDVSAIPGGMYLVSVLDGEKSALRPFVKTE